MVRIGVVGVGNMGRSHIANIKDGKVKDGVLTAACDILPERLDWLKENGYHDVLTFSDAESMFKSGEVDLVIIAVPHYDHPPLAELAFGYGLNVIIEKPACPAYVGMPVTCG